MGATPACPRRVESLRAISAEVATRARGAARVRDGPRGSIGISRPQRKVNCVGRVAARRGVVVARAAPDRALATHRAMRPELVLHASVRGDGRAWSSRERRH